MTIKKISLQLAVLFLAVLLTGCMSMGSGAKTAATGAAAGASAQNANSGLEHCDASLGTVSIFEDKDESWYHHLTSDLRLPSTVPVIRLLAQQSNCFVVVERGRSMKAMTRERELMQSGEMRSGSNFGKGQMVAADYTITPSISFSSNNSSGGTGMLGGLLKSARVNFNVGLGIKKSDASTVLTLIENRSGVQLAAAEGNAENTDFSLMGGLFGSRVGGKASGYSNTSEGKVILAAFTDSMNNLIRALKAYKAQNVKGGLGTGGSLGVQGSTTAQ